MKLQTEQRDEKSRSSPEQTSSTTERKLPARTLQSIRRSSVRWHKGAERRSLPGKFSVVQPGMLDKAPGAVCAARSALLGQRAGRGAASALSLLPWIALQRTLSCTSHGPHPLLRLNLHRNHHNVESVEVFEIEHQQFLVRTRRGCTRVPDSSCETEGLIMLVHLSCRDSIARMHARFPGTSGVYQRPLACP